MTVAGQQGRMVMWTGLIQEAFSSRGQPLVVFTIGRTGPAQGCLMALCSVHSISTGINSQMGLVHRPCPGLFDYYGLLDRFMSSVVTAVRLKKQQAIYCPNEIYCCLWILIINTLNNHQHLNNSWICGCWAKKHKSTGISDNKDRAECHAFCQCTVMKSNVTFHILQLTQSWTSAKIMLTFYI